METGAGLRPQDRSRTRPDRFCRAQNEPAIPHYGLITGGRLPAGNEESYDDTILKLLRGH